MGAPDPYWCAWVEALLRSVDERLSRRLALTDAGGPARFLSGAERSILASEIIEAVEWWFRLNVLPSDSTPLNRLVAHAAGAVYLDRLAAAAKPWTGPRLDWTRNAWRHLVSAEDRYRRLRLLGFAENMTWLLPPTPAMKVRELIWVGHHLAPRWFDWTVSGWARRKLPPGGIVPRSCVGLLSCVGLCWVQGRARADALKTICELVAGNIALRKAWESVQETRSGLALQDWGEEIVSRVYGWMSI